jgi:hypothetical protein
MVNLGSLTEGYIQVLLAKRVINDAGMLSYTRIDMTQVVPIDNKTNHYVTEDEQQLVSTYSDSAISYIYNNDNNNKDSQKRSNNNNSHNDTIHELDLAYGLIDLLIKNNYTVESLTNTNSSRLSYVLSIDQEVAAIICAAAKKKQTISTGRRIPNIELDHRTRHNQWLLMIGKP